LSLAEASIDDVIGRLRGGNFNSLLPVSYGNGSYWAGVDSTATPLRFRVTGHGLISSSQRNVEVIAQLIEASVFQFALFGSDGIDVSGNAVTDSYDSRDGAYDPNSAGQNGDVGTNSVAVGGVEISGSIAINGQVVVGPDVEDPSEVVVVNGGSALITGIPPFVSQSEALIMPSVQVPAGLSCSNLRVNASETITLSSAVGEYCFTSVDITAGGTLTADGPVKVYVTRTLDVSGHAVIGVPSNPSNMIFLITSNVHEANIENDITGTTEFYGAIYAPWTLVDISGDAVIYGSVIAQNVEISGNAEVHYDEALADLTNPTGLYRVRVYSWREL
jgi:hypothetical protein